MPDPDGEIMERVRDGDDDAVTELVERYQNELVGFFYHHCWDQGLAEELAQTVFVKVYQARRRWQATAKVRTYLCRIAHNAWIDHLRRQRRHVSLDAEIGDSGLRLVDTLATEQAHDDTPDEGAGATRHRVQEAIEKLPEGQKAVFVLANSHDMKYQQIAEVLDIPEGTVKSRMHAAVRALRHYLADMVQA